MKISVQVRNDHLEFLARAKPLAALAELIWNALDAEATEVHVEFAENALGGLESIRVRDNGHGLLYDHALVVFRNLGGSWKREESATSNRRRMLHGKYGKGRFRAFALGQRVSWKTVYRLDSLSYRYEISGRAATLGEFELTDPAPAGSAPIGLTVEIDGMAPNIELLRGTKANADITDLFAPYLRQYPDVRIVYDGVPLDPANAEDRSTTYDLGVLVMESGERVQAELTITEWLQPGRRNVFYCDENGFALHPAKLKPVFQGFSYTAYLKSAHLSALEREGLLPVQDMSPDLKQLLDETRLRLRQHFTLREAERHHDTIEQWKATGLYPYDAGPVTAAEEAERRAFDIYATHLSRYPEFADAAPRTQRLLLKMLQGVMKASPNVAARVLDDLISLPEDMSPLPFEQVEEPAERS